MRLVTEGLRCIRQAQGLHPAHSSTCQASLRGAPAGRPPFMAAKRVRHPAGRLTAAAGTRTWVATEDEGLALALNHPRMPTRGFFVFSSWLADAWPSAA